MKRNLSVNDDWAIEHVTHQVNCGVCTQSVGRAILNGRFRGSVEEEYTILSDNSEHTARVTR